MRSTLVAIAFALVALILCHGRAVAALHVCDASDEPATIAIAVLEPNATGTQSESEGWFHIDAHTCSRVIDTDLNAAARYFLYAKSTSLVWRGTQQRSSRDTQFCTNVSTRFFYFNRPASQCIGEGAEMQWFINEPATAPDWTITLFAP
ncbi:MAG: DUF1036 domain-containing protein [bacterium]|nr:DUF1036 domain-containing protein [bacterium]